MHRTGSKLGDTGNAYICDSVNSHENIKLRCVINGRI
jgi:hypothetical protein